MPKPLTALASAGVYDYGLPGHLSRQHLQRIQLPSRRRVLPLIGTELVVSAYGRRKGKGPSSDVRAAMKDAPTIERNSLSATAR